MPAALCAVDKFALRQLGLHPREGIGGNILREQCMRQHYKPLAGLSGLLRFFLKAYIASHVLWIASEIWTYCSLTRSVAELKALDQSLDERKQETDELIAESRRRSEESQRVLTAAKAAIKEAEALLGSATTEGNQTDGGEADQVHGVDVLVDEQQAAALGEDHVGSGPMPLFEEPAPDEPGASSFDVYSGLAIAVAHFLLYLVTGALFLKWIYRISRNLRAFSGVEMKYTPSWAVWSYFVPIANLFVPPAVMREIWAVSHRSTSGGLVSLWWLSVVASEVVGRFFMGVLKKASSFDSLTSGRLFLFSLGDDVVKLLVTVLTLMMVARISAAYDRNIVETSPGET